MSWHSVGYSDEVLQEVAHVIRETNRRIVQTSEMCSNAAQYISRKFKEANHYDDVIMVGLDDSTVFEEKYAAIAVSLMKFQEEVEQLLKEAENKAQTKIETRNKETKEKMLFL